MTDTGKKMCKSNFNLRSLRISLKYRPEILKLILKMRQCIRKKKVIIIKLKHRIKEMENNLKTSNDFTEANNIAINTNVDIAVTNSVPPMEVDETSESKHSIKEGAIEKPKTKDRLVQTDDATDSTKKDTLSKIKALDEEKEESGWQVDKDKETKSIADQVKEAAQDAIEQSGMVYVETAGMYYDYKTGYYYNSELGLYYHTDTECYYYYSEDKQSFVFHSYPVRNAASAALLAHEKRKARKHKMDRKAEEDIDNLTKNLSQDGQEDANGENKPKRKKSKKKAEKKVSSSKTGKEKEKDEAETSEQKEVTIEITTENVVDTEKDKHDEAGKENKGEAAKENKDEAEKENKEDVGNENKEEAEKGKEETDKEGEKVKVENGSEKKPENNEELEDGECSDTGSETSDSDDDVDGEDEEVKSNASTSTASDDESIARQHPPCMRVIVRETKLPKLRVGSLFIVTKDGGTIGREGEHHAILLSDHNVSRNHLDIRYDITHNSYMATDLGSKNGSILNGVRMSESQQYSEPMMVMHGSTLQLGETKLLCHIHPGNDTCGQCEPGLLIEASEKDKKIAYTRTCSVKKQHELELARLKNKYGAKHMLAIEESAYNDRAQARRETVGSSHHAEKTQAADIDTSIAPENKGFKLLEKMGWNKGEGLGKESQGDVEPVPLISNAGKTGLGAPQPIIINRVSKIGPATLRLASRTKMLQPPAKAFQNPLEEDSE